MSPIRENAFKKFLNNNHEPHYKERPYSLFSVEEKNYWLGKLAFATLVALKLAQWDGKTARNLRAENLFLLRWLQTTLKQKRFYRCVVHDFEWLINIGQQHLMTLLINLRDKLFGYGTAFYCIFGLISRGRRCNGTT